MKAVVTLSPEQSKRLIAKAICAMEAVRHARRDGIIGLARCTTNAYVAEELTGRPLADRGAYCSGFFSAKGLCAVQGKVQEKLLVLDHGKEHWLGFGEGNVANFTDRMGASDVIIKSGSVMDPTGKVACLIAHPTGGELGAYLPPILEKGIRFLIPMTLNKTQGLPLERMIEALAGTNVEDVRCHGLKCRLVEMPGQVVTEADAFRELAGVAATPVATGGIASGAGAILIVLEGSKTEVDKAWDLIASIRGEPSLPEPAVSCGDCYIAAQPGLGNRCSPIEA